MTLTVVPQLNIADHATVRDLGLALHRRNGHLMWFRPLHTPRGEYAAGVITHGLVSRFILGNHGRVWEDRYFDPDADRALVRDVQNSLLSHQGYTELCRQRENLLPFAVRIEQERHAGGFCSDADFADAPAAAVLTAVGALGSCYIVPEIVAVTLLGAGHGLRIDGSGLGDSPTPEEDAVYAAIESLAAAPASGIQPGC